MAPDGAPAAPDVAEQAAAPRSPGPSLLLAAGIAAVSCLAAFAALLAVSGLRSHSLELGYSPITRAALTVVVLAAAAGLIAALVIAVMAVRSGAGHRATSLRTRSFVVIAIAIVIPALCLSALGVWAYYRSWDTASVLYGGQAAYGAGELSSEIAGIGKMAGRYSPAEQAVLSRAIVLQYGARGHLGGAYWSTLSDIRHLRVLPTWAVKRLRSRGFAIGGPGGPARADAAVLVAWRVGPNAVRYYAYPGVGSEGVSAPVPLHRLVPIALLGIVLITVLGVLGAGLLSRGVVRPVRRLAAASGRLADGEVGVTVEPEGPRELRELATSFNDMNAKLAKAQEAEQSFLLSVSHELKTPLTSIRGYAEGIGDGTVPAPEGAAVIGAESGRLERLVGDLLDSARMRKSAFTVGRETVDLNEVAAEVARRYEGVARDAGLSLNLKTEPTALVTADHDRVLQVASNLVENAVRCTPPPGTVTVSVGPGGLSVADTGPGLPADDVSRAFERFYLHNRYGSDRPVGTGLGLAIVKELVEAMGGAVRVSSALGVGTAFIVSLPPADAAPAVADAAVADAAPAAPDDAQ